MNAAKDICTGITTFETIVISLSHRNSGFPLTNTGKINKTVIATKPNNAANKKIFISPLRNDFKTGTPCSGYRYSHWSAQGSEDSKGDRSELASVPNICRLNSSQVAATVACSSSYFDGRTSTCMKLPSALMLLTRTCVPVFGTITLPIGFGGL